MAIDLNDEIMGDFLVEAGEILELLNEQLVDLEQAPEDSDLLNSIFRGFHTIKGGASFLSLTNLVEVCHKAEDVFNLLRNRELVVNAQMMDVFLRVLDEVNRMFEEIRSAEDPSAAAFEVMQDLDKLQNGGDLDAPADIEEVSAEAEEIQQEVVEEIPEEASAAEESSDGKPATAAGQDFVAGGDDITDDEFESLLDALQSKDDSADEANDKSEPQQVSADQSAASSDAPASDEITDDEFEALLDSLHGSGGKPDAKSENTEATDQAAKDNSAAAADKPAAAKPEAKSIPKAEAKPEAKPEPKPKAESKVAAKIASPQSPAKKPAPADTTVRVDTARLDAIMNLVGELVLARNRLNTLKDTFEDDRVHKAISNLDVVTGDLQSAVMKTRMQPVKKVFGRFPRVVRDLARSLKKEVSLELVGEETDLDKNLVEALADPLVHLVRNSVDHGIEDPDTREKAGKAREGKVTLAAQQEGDHILLSITDDGAGMDPEVLRNKVVEKGLMDAETASRLDDKGCFDLIFMPGLSTKQDISDVSGRGVGMDVVKTKITQLNGTVVINSAIGKGTELRIKVPLTLAILPTLMVQIGSRKFALPLSNVSEIFELSSKKTNIVDGREVVLNRGKAPPVFYLRKWLLNGSEATEPKGEEPQVIMVQVANSLVWLVVDQVIGQEEVVIKPLGAMLHGLPGLAGSTITGDGNIAIILDVQSLLQQFA